MNQNMPIMASAAHTHAVYSTADLGASGPSGPPGPVGATYATIDPDFVFTPKGNLMAVPARRVVKVLIADPNENISLDECLLFRGEEKVTDATDQELFFELDIKTLLEQHNEKRTKIVDKKVKDRIEYLEPAKVRDLKMVVVTVANL